MKIGYRNYQIFIIMLKLYLVLHNNCTNYLVCYRVLIKIPER
jgi:hypothetical protein